MNLFNHRRKLLWPTKRIGVRSAARTSIMRINRGSDARILNATMIGDGILRGERNRKNLRLRFLLVLALVIIGLWALGFQNTVSFTSDIMYRLIRTEETTQIVHKAHAQVPPTQEVKVTPKVTGTLSTGIASYYDYTLSSGWSSKGHRVCASRDFPRQTLLRVTNLANGKSVDCLVTDYGPDKSVHPDRIIDLSSTAFSQIASLSAGLTKVSVQKVK